MKRQYITPSVFCVKLDPKRTFLDGSNLEQSEETITNETEGGWAREYNSDDNNSNGGSIWDNAW